MIWCLRTISHQHGLTGEEVDKRAIINLIRMYMVAERVPCHSANNATSNMAWNRLNCIQLIFGWVLEVNTHGGNFLQYRRHANSNSWYTSNKVLSHVTGGFPNRMPCWNPLSYLVYSAVMAFIYFSCLTLASVWKLFKWNWLSKKNFSPIWVFHNFVTCFLYYMQKGQKYNMLGK